MKACASSVGTPSDLWDQPEMWTHARRTCILPSSSWARKAVVEREGRQPVSRHGGRCEAAK
jgi:hypothetical protein